MDVHVLLLSNLLQNNLVKLLSFEEIYNSRKRALNKEKQKHLLRALYHYKKVQILTHSFLMKRSIDRKIWKLNRTSTFSEKEVMLNTGNKFKEDFRMNRRVFQKLCHILKDLERKNTNWRKAIPLEKRISIALYALGSSAEYRTVGNLFGVGRTTVGEIVLDFCNEVWEKMKPIYMNDYPLTRTTIENHLEEFDKMGFPQCLGAIGKNNSSTQQLNSQYIFPDGCHIEVSPTKYEALDYYNYKGWYSIVLLALVDARYRFMYIHVGAPGRCNDSGLFESSFLKKYHEQSQLIKGMTRNINDINVPVVIIGDSAFRLSRILLKPFPFNCVMTDEQRVFNKRLSRCRRVVENAFGHMKARFRRIGKGLENRIDNVNIIVQACCVLHNFLIAEKDSILRSWVDESQQITTAPRDQPTTATTIGDDNIDGNIIRNALARHFENFTDY